ncbi:hypothetical protein [Longivirga aurantiaca]|uniref:Beta-ketoacyl synthase N-terminal domain-containing protein n=1 Tax=Longivirga aurantiaca TaxID=1837743 RepID=A0ABW1T150_9ACTN
MITGAAFVPSAPMLVPVVAQGAAADLDDIRAASLDAVRRALAAPAQRVVIVGAGTATRTHSAGTASFRGFGVPYDVPLDPAAPGGDPLPLALSVGAWLLAQVGWPGERLALEVAATADDDELDDAGIALAQGGIATALLVVADGSAARSERAPAHLHPGAEAFDASVAAALSIGDPGLLAAIDRAVAREVAAAGRPAWRTAATALHGLRWDAALLADTAPLGVGYVAAAWTR